MKSRYGYESSSCFISLASFGILRLLYVSHAQVYLWVFHLVLFGISMISDMAKHLSVNKLIVFFLNLLFWICCLHLLENCILSQVAFLTYSFVGSFYILDMKNIILAGYMCFIYFFPFCGLFSISKNSSDKQNFPLWIKFNFSELLGLVLLYKSVSYTRE